MELAVKAGDDPFAAKASPNGYYYTDNEQGAMKRSFAASYLDQISCWKHAQRLMQTAPYDFDKRCYDRLSEIQIMSAMLVAGKIACMDKKANNDEDLVRLALDTCSDSLEEAGLLGKGFRRLSKGYKVKVLLYKLNRELYLKVYGKWKR
jgi:hypothetical protein